MENKSPIKGHEVGLEMQTDVNPSVKPNNQKRLNKPRPRPGKWPERQQA